MNVGHTLFSFVSAVWIIKYLYFSNISIGPIPANIKNLGIKYWCAVISIICTINTKLIKLTAAKSFLSDNTIFRLHDCKQTGFQHDNHIVVTRKVSQEIRTNNGSANR